jgi:preprotein translocase subunit SecY
MQLMTMALPSVEALSKEGDYGRRKISQYTRYLTVPLALLQAYGTVLFLQQSTLEVNPLAGRLAIDACVP